MTQTTLEEARELYKRCTLAFQSPSTHLPITWFNDPDNKECYYIVYKNDGVIKKNISEGSTPGFRIFSGDLTELDDYKILVKDGVKYE